MDGAKQWGEGGGLYGKILTFSGIGAEKVMGANGFDCHFLGQEYSTFWEVIEVPWCCESRSRLLLVEVLHHWRCQSRSLGAASRGPLALRVEVQGAASRGPLRC